MSRLIGVGGFAKSGKDAFVDFLQEHHGWARTYMSKALEEALMRLNPWVNINYDNWVTDDLSRNTWPKETLWNHGHLSTRFIRYRDLHAIVGYAKSKDNNDVRDLLQKLGTEVGRDMCDPEVWIRWAFADIDDMLTSGYDVAITGIRYDNELGTLHARGGVSVWVNRPGYGPVNGHTSDNTLGRDDFDIVIENDGSLSDLEWAAHYFHQDTALWGEVAA